MASKALPDLTLVHLPKLISPNSCPAPHPSHFILPLRFQQLAKILPSDPLYLPPPFLGSFSSRFSHGWVLIFQAACDLNFICSWDFLLSPVQNCLPLINSLTLSWVTDFTAFITVWYHLFFGLPCYFYKRYTCTLCNESDSLLGKRASLTLLPHHKHLPLPGDNGFHLFSTEYLSLVSVRNLLILLYSLIFQYKVLSVNLPQCQRWIWLSPIHKHTCTLPTLYIHNILTS